MVREEIEKFRNRVKTARGQAERGEMVLRFQIKNEQTLSHLYNKAEIDQPAIEALLKAIELSKLLPAEETTLSLSSFYLELGSLYIFSNKEKLAYLAYTNSCDLLKTHLVKVMNANHQPLTIEEATTVKLLRPSALDTEEITTLKAML